MTCASFLTAFRGFVINYGMPRRGQSVPVPAVPAALNLLQLPFLRSRHARIPPSRLQRRHTDSSDALSTLDAKEAPPPGVALLCYSPLVRPSSGSRGRTAFGLFPPAS